MPVDPTAAPVLREGDRRSGPRRADDIELHYARELLIETALQAADEWAAGLEPGMDALDRLVEIAKAYRSAEHAVTASA